MRINLVEGFIIFIRTSRLKFAFIFSKNSEFERRNLPNEIYVVDRKLQKSTDKAPLEKNDKTYNWTPLIYKYICYIEVHGPTPFPPLKSKGKQN